VRQALEEYFQHLDGDGRHEVLRGWCCDAVERPMLEVVMHHARGNQTLAARDPRHQPQHAAQEAASSYGLDG
jgi:DNA-binding protein Fis